MKTIASRLLTVVFMTVTLLLFCPLLRCEAQAADHETVYEAAIHLYADNSTAPLNAAVSDSGVYQESTWQKITYQGASGRVSGLLFLPTKPAAAAAGVAKILPCLILLHGLGGSKEQMIPVARFMAGIGYASWAIDDVGAGDRKAPGGALPVYSTIPELAAGVCADTETTVVDQRRGLDYLDTRSELDHSRYGVVGFSLGALVGGVFSAVDPRIKAAILVSGGGNLGEIMVAEAKINVAFGKMYPQLLSTADPVQLEGLLQNIDPINFVAHIAPRPLLMEHGRLDTIIPPDTAQALFDAAEQPKQIDWYPNAGHPPPPMTIFPAVSAFLYKYLPLAGQ